MLLVYLSADCQLVSDEGRVSCVLSHKGRVL